MLDGELDRALSCPVERDRPLAPLCSLGVGGRAELYVEPDRIEDFRALRLSSVQRGFPVHILGGGTNVLFPDGLVRGAVLSTRRWTGASWREGEDGGEIEVRAGQPLPLLVDEAARRGLGGLEFAIGIPGTVGGALTGNAGAGGRSVGELVTEVTSLEPDGSLRTWRREDISYAYRSFALAEEGRLFLSLRMVLRSRPSEEIKAEVERFRAMRAMQPRGVRSAGCVFKNPPGQSAGRILDQCGCKGMEVGDAVVSDVHANFILDRGRATSSDVVSLMRACQERAFERTGIWLEPEVKAIGFEGAHLRPGLDFEGKSRPCADRGYFCSLSS